MRRKEKRLLQAVALVLAALVLLPNVGLWALYRERQPDGTPGGSGAAVAPAAGQGSHNQQKKTFFLGDGQKLKDWHDKEAIRRDAQRVGNGEQGRPYPMTDAERVDQAYRENGFNIYVSDKISLNRSLPDIRHPNCNSKRYLETLPNTSIIIPFHNEGWSSLLRTVHSVLNRSPPELIAEIVLVDDFSDRGPDWYSCLRLSSKNQASLFLLPHPPGGRRAAVPLESLPFSQEEGGKTEN
uniref:Polypeptide N-acetylgalactosaminyltransferase 10 n=2 Tax=Equus TaxID=9789 RepID=A0A3Q2HGH3_HORSE